MTRRSHPAPALRGRVYTLVATLLVAASAQAAPVTDIGSTPTGATSAPTGVTAVPTPGAPVDGATTPPAGLSETPRGTSSPFGPQAPQTTVLYDLPGGAILLPADLDEPSPTDAETLRLDDGQAPPIWYGPLELTDDASLGAFCDAGYDSVDGTLVVTGAVTDLRGIDCLTWVGGDLIVEEADDLLVFDGFPLLVEVRGTLELRDLPLADPVLGFDSLVRVGGDVRLEQLFATTEVPWFPVLGEVGGHIEVFELDALTELQWMPQLAILGGSVDISDNQRLEWIAELPNLASVSDHVSIRWNPSLQDQDLVPALDWIGGDLEFWGNQMAALQLDGVIVDGYVDAGLR